MKRTFTKRLDNVLAAVLTVVALVAGQTAWAQSFPTASGGTGTENDPYLIKTTADLDALASDVNNGNNYRSDGSHPDGYFFQLDNDIEYDPNVLTLDLDGDGTNESNFPGIGGAFWVDEYSYFDRLFDGTFDGTGHTISGLRLDKTNCNYDNKQYVGLFGMNYGTLKNVTVSNANISGYAYVGGIVGENIGTIENCHVTATVTVTASESSAGGIVGNNNYGFISGSISGCTSAATVSGQSRIGGIAGENACDATIENCLANGATITATDYKGGAIVGENNCYEGAYNAILSRNYYTNCTLTIGSNSPATTNIGCGNKADGTRTPTDVTEMTVKGTTYINGAVNSWVTLKNQLAEASTDAENPTVITLDRDVVAGSGDRRLVVEINRHAVIDLNGHKIDRGLTEPASEGNVIHVRGNASLVIRDSQGGGQITGGYITNGSGGGITSTSNSRVTLEGGTICGNKSNNHAGGVFVGGTFTMTGGTITDNTCTANGSAIYSNDHTINLQGGTITGNKGKNAIYLDSNAGGRLNVSGKYDVSGNTLADGTTAAPDIMLNGRVITISGALNPVHPATVAFDSGGPMLTSGWSTYMSTVRPSTCFVARAYDIANGKVIGKLDDELVLGTPEVVYWHADSDHDGTSEKPYVITTTDGLDLLANRVNSGNSYSGTYFRLDADIAYDPNELTLDLDGDDNNESNFPGIGGSFMVNESFMPTYRFFGGSFDGDGHTISGLHIHKNGQDSGNDYVGLFGYNIGIVKNVTESNASLSGHYEVGGIVGRNDGTIENCLVSAATVSGYSEVGGIAGENDNGDTIENCLANGVSITATDYLGGAIVGENNCYNGAYNAILSRNYYTGCTLTIGSGNNVTTATTNIGCGHKATEDAGTYTPTDITEMTVNSTTYSNGAISALILADNADNTSVINAHNGETVNVVLQGRTLYKDGKWNTLCLPFNLNVLNIKQNADNPLHGATIMTFDAVSWYNAEGEYVGGEYLDGCHRSGQIENGNLYLYFFKYMEGNNLWGADLSTGEPLLVKWDGDGSDNIVNPVFKGVTISNDTDMMNYSTKEGSDATTHDGNVTFKSTYSPITFDAENKSVLFMGGNSTLYYPEAGATIGAFRAYFELNNGLSAGDVDAQNVKMFFGDTTDGVGSIENGKLKIENEAGAWYTLDGRKVQVPSLSPSLGEGRGGLGRGGLPSGIYIHNGSKVVIK